MRQLIVSLALSLILHTSLLCANDYCVVVNAATYEDSSWKAVADALARVNMSDFTQRQIGELSGGQKKRVFLARALAQQSRVILLDEPFTGVDVNTEDAIIALLQELRDDGHVILVSTHNLGSVPHFCDSVVLINRTVLDYGDTKSVFTQSNLQRAFGGTLRFHVLGPKL